MIYSLYFDDEVRPRRAVDLKVLINFPMKITVPVGVLLRNPINRYSIMFSTLKLRFLSRVSTLPQQLLNCD